MKVNSKGIANESFVLSFVQLFYYCSTILQAMILSRAFSKLEYGTYSQANLVVSFIAPFLLLGLSNAANYFYNQQNMDLLSRERVVKTIYTLILGLGILGGLSLLGLRHLVVMYFSNQQLLKLLYIIAFRPLLLNLLSFFQILYISVGKTYLLAIRNTIISIIQLVIVILSAQYFKSAQIILLFVTFTDFFLIIIFHFYFNKHFFRLSLIVPTKASTKNIVGYALPLALSTAVGTLSINMDTMMIGRFLTTENFALYSNMAKELPFNLIIGSFAAVVLPKIVKLNSENNNVQMLRLYKLYLEFGLITTWILVISAFVCSKELVLVLYSAKYVKGLSIFQVYLLISSLRFTYYGALLSTIGDTKSILRYSIYSLLINFIFNIVLFHFLGMIGPAIATLLTVLSSGILQLKKGCQRFSIKLNSLFDFKYLTRFILSSMIVVIVLLKIKYYLAFLPIILETLILYLLSSIALVLINYKRIRTDYMELNSY